MLQQMGGRGSIRLNTGSGDRVIEVRPNVMIGFLGAAMIAMAWVADFILTPAVLSYIPVKDSQIGHIGEETESDD